MSDIESNSNDIQVKRFFLTDEILITEIRNNEPDYIMFAAKREYKFNDNKIATNFYSCTIQKDRFAGHRELLKCGSKIIVTGFPSIVEKIDKMGNPKQYCNLKVMSIYPAHRDSAQINQNGGQQEQKVSPSAPETKNSNRIPVEEYPF